MRRPTCLKKDGVSVKLFMYEAPRHSGIEQRFWEAMILGSWLMGCLPNVPLEQISRPRTYGELQEWLCTLFPITDTGPARSRRMELLKILGFTGGKERVFNNPMTCVPCARHLKDGRVVYCPIVLDPKYRCKNQQLPCCPNDNRHSKYSLFHTDEPLSYAEYYHEIQIQQQRDSAPRWLKEFDINKLPCYEIRINRNDPAGDLGETRHHGT